MYTNQTGERVVQESLTVIAHKKKSLYVLLINPNELLQEVQFTYTTYLQEPV